MSPVAYTRSARVPKAETPRWRESSICMQELPIPTPDVTQSMACQTLDMRSIGLSLAFGLDGKMQKIDSAQAIERADRQHGRRSANPRRRLLGCRGQTTLFPLYGVSTATSDSTNARSGVWPRSVRYRTVRRPRCRSLGTLGNFALSY